MKSRLNLIFVLLVSFFCSPLSHATQIIPSTLESMTDLSDTIVIGKVRDINSYMEDGKIFTNVTIDVREFVKNSKGVTSGSIDVKYLGGRVGDITLEVDGAPVFELNEKVLLFLRQANSYYRIFGFNYGKYKIFFDEKQGVEFIDGPLFHSPVQYDPRTMMKKDIPEPMGREELIPFIEKLKGIVR